MRLAAVSAAILAAGITTLVQAGGEAWAGDALTKPSRHWRAGAKSDGGGIRLGGFLTYLAADIATTYVDNLFATDEALVADVVAQARMAAEVESDWRSHGLAFRGVALGKAHTMTSSEDTVDYRASVDGFIDILPGTKVGGMASYAREHEDRASPNDARGSEPTPVDHVRAQVDAEQQFASLGLSFAASYEDLDFQDADFFGIATINNDDRDRTLWSGSARLRYDGGGRLRPFVHAAYDTTDYAAARDDNGFARDSDALEGAVGAELALGRATSGLIAIGYRRQDFEDARLGTVSGLTLQGRLDTDLGRSSRMELIVGRELRETTVPGASGFFETAADMRFKHRLLPKLHVNLTAGYARNDFRGIDRIDEVYRAGAGLEYALSGYARFRAQYEFTTRESSADADFTLNRVTSGLRLRF
ncbi:outer membrane beta-barrel protein [Ferruginivarius sediminum]|uniref:Outer membrane protein beta-barrel domain-containing protein n=1 Tax=Ferruginivarius sediminum TaxID=2661937 RepID=A0A369TD03_9PROT|nr:outer membrane beta-barrel protein [Ferruginivarius sediminum]RDD63168.1 hypothetical protein DRB17_05230 [Ferruginivarius sediminum]